MAFFDELGKKVSEAGQKTLQKTKELSDTARLNSMLSDEERRIDNYYFEIGKLYAFLHGNDYEEDFATMIQGIEDAKCKMQDLKKQIQEVKGVQTCEKCGAEVPKEAAFCSSCGGMMPKAQVEVPMDLMKCESCGAFVKSGMRFCTSCGKPLEVVEKLADVEKEQQTLIEEQEEVKEKVCVNCGAKLTDDLVFCTECGTKI